MVQRITPSIYSFRQLDFEELEIKDLDIANYIARLAGDHVTEEDQASVIRLDKDVDLFEIVNMKSIYELIKVKGDDIVGKERKILESSDLKEEILNKLGTNLKSLALDIGSEARSKEEITPIIRDVLESSFSSQLVLRGKAKERANLLAKRFSDVLKQLSILYKMQ